MAWLLRMPAPAAGVTSAVLLDWSLAEHAAFVRSDVLAVVETDKAVIEIEAEADGVLHRRLVPAGRQVVVGTPIAIIGSPADTAEEIAARVAEAHADPTAVPTAAAPRGGSTAPAAPASFPASTPVSTGPANGDAGGGIPRVFASPIARRMAKDAGLALAELTATGPGGRIVRRDVESAVAARHGATGTRDAGETPAQPLLSVAAPASEGIGDIPAAVAPRRTFTDEPRSRMRRAIADRLTESKRTVPHFYLRATANVDALLALRTELNTAPESAITVTDLLVRAVARAHRVVPQMNVSHLPDAVRHYDFVDVGVAVATDDGLLAPVLRDVDRLPITAVSAAIADAAGRARGRRLRQSELEGGSITVTNLGMFGVEEFTAIIKAPQSAILAVGAARREPVATPDGLHAATVMHLVLSVDHRVLDGAVAARWMAALVELLEHPARILV